MLRLRSSIAARILSSTHSSPISTLHRLLSASARAAPAASPSPSFVVEDYLVGTCGLTPAQALRASEKLSHLKSPSKPDAVLAFLAGLHLSGTHVAALVAKDPKFLCADVEKTLSPVFVGLTGHGLAHTEVVRLLPLAPYNMRRRSILSNLPYYLSLLGSYDNLLRVLKKNSYFLSSDIENVGKPNVALLRECGLTTRQIAKLFIAQPRLLTSKLKHLKAMVACAEGLGVRRDSGMFRQALQAVAYLSQDKIAAKVDYLKNTFRWSDAEVAISVCKFPTLLVRSKEMLQRRSVFLIDELGLEPAFIANRPIILSLSLEGRLRPRFYVVKFLKEKRLLDRDWSYPSIFKATEKVFLDKFICPHKESAPHLAEDYIAVCRGEVPISFRFT